MAKAKEQNYLHGAAIMTAGVIIMKILGALYKIPLGNMLGDDGYGLFLQAYYVQPVSYAGDGWLPGGSLSHDKRGADLRTSASGAPYISGRMVDFLCTGRRVLDRYVHLSGLARGYAYPQPGCRIEHSGACTCGTLVLHYLDLQRPHSGLRQYEADNRKSDP